MSQKLRPAIALDIAPRGSVGRLCHLAWLRAVAVIAEALTQIPMTRQLGHDLCGRVLTRLDGLID